MSNGTDVAQRIRLLRLARRRVAQLARPAALAGFRRDAKRLGATITRLRKDVGAGNVSKRVATAAIRRLTKSQREVLRLMAASKAATTRTLAEIDREIDRLRGGD